MSNSNFYSKSLTLLPLLLEMINEGCISSDIAIKLGISRPLLSYHIKKAKNSGFVTEACTDTCKIYEVTQPGKNFLAMYQQQHNKAGQQQTTSKICSLNNMKIALENLIHDKLIFAALLDMDSGLSQLQQRAHRIREMAKPFSNQIRDNEYRRLIPGCCPTQDQSIWDYR